MVKPESRAIAVDLAETYQRYVSASWRGDAAAAAFGTRLGGYWQPALPPRPAAAPDAVSVHGGGGRGIAWYQRQDQVFGYLPEAAGGLAIPVADVPRLQRSLPAEARA
ncbi:MAG: hypothetical protein KC442_18635 [Thermomicrobiales bacterium]|nr:hypothetical protein [Thermomicrobiales bacterium]